MTHRGFWLIFVTIAAIRVILAANVPLFGDEAFYWQESRRSAFGYTDLPPGTAWAIAASTGLFGDSLLALRLPSIAAGLLVVVLIRSELHRLEAPSQTTSMVSMLVLLLPMAQAVGVLALPDALLTFALVVSAIGLVRALDDPSWTHWLWFGVGLALAWLLHWRTGVFYLGGLALMLFDPRARSLWTNRRHFIAQLVGLAGLIPSLMFNAGLDWPALRFQAVDRHDWGFHVGGLMMPIEQAMVVSPILFGVLIGCCWRQLRAPESSTLRAYAWLGGGVFAAYFVLGCFADQERTRVHWPLPATLLMLPLLLAWRPAGSAAWRWMMAVAIIGSMLVVGGLAMLRVSPDRAEPFGKRFGANFLGYSEVARQVRPLLAEEPDRLLITDNFLLGAQLDWHLGRTPFVLDSPRNAEHGRAEQLALWSLDESALAATPWRKAILVIDDSALFAADRFDFHRSLCTRLGGMTFLEEVPAISGQRRFTIWAIDRNNNECEQPILSMLFPIEHRKDHIIVAGYAVQHQGRVRNVRLERDGKTFAVDPLDTTGPIVDTHWPELVDGNVPNVGYRFELPRSSLGIGPHDYRLIAEADNGQQREIGRVVLDADVGRLSR